MSLTSQLENKESPISLFLRDQFPHTRDMTVLANVETKQSSMISSPDGAESYELGSVGQAVDYRIRFNYAEMDVKQTVARAAAFWVRGELREILPDFFDELAEFQARIRPERGELERDDEDKLCRFCYTMALLDVMIRTHKIHKDLEWSPQDVHELINKPRQSLIDDIAAQNALYREAMSNFLDRPAVLNPTFEGSSDVGGADADLMVDGCLIELKSGKKPINSNDIRQVLGYYLLDYEDKREITSLAIYRTRHGVCHRWSVDDILLRTKDPRKPVSVIRAELRETLHAARWREMRVGDSN